MSPPNFVATLTSQHRLLHLLACICCLPTQKCTAWKLTEIVKKVLPKHLKVPFHCGVKNKPKASYSALDEWSVVFSCHFNCWSPGFCKTKCKNTTQYDNETVTNITRGTDTLNNIASVRATKTDFGCRKSCERWTIKYMIYLICQMAEWVVYWKINKQITLM